MSERHNVIDIFTKRRLSPERRAHLIQRLADLDAELEPMQREAEQIRRALGLIAVEQGLGDGA